MGWHRRSRVSRWVPVGLLAATALTVVLSVWSGSPAHSSTTSPAPVAGASGPQGVAAAVYSARLVREVGAPIPVAAVTASAPRTPPGSAGREPVSGSAARPVPVQAPDAGSSCQVWNLGGCVAGAVDEVMKRAVTAVINPAADMLGRTLLSTPSLTELPRIAELWGMSWRLVLAIYATVILVGGLIIMGHQTVQTRSTARDVLPRLLIGLVAGVVSLPLCGMAIDIANAVSRSVMGEGVDPVAGAGGLVELLTLSLGGAQSQAGLLLIGMAVGVALIAVLCGWIARVSVLVCLIAAAPLALMWHALPQTESVARWWWRAVAGCLLMQVAQSLVLVVGLRILLSPGQTSAGIFGTQLNATSGLPSMLVLLVLLWILWQIPGWVWRSWIGGGNLGAGKMLTSLLKVGVAIKTGGLMAGALSGIGAAKNRSSPRSSRSGAASGTLERAAGADSESGSDPGDSQLMLPIRATRIRNTTATSRLKPQSPWIAYHPSLRDKIPAGYVGNRFAENTTGDRRSEEAGTDAKGQLELPIEAGEWPEQRPVQEPGGQWRWPIEVPHVPQTRAASTLRRGSPWIEQHPSLRGKIAPNYVGNRFAAHPPETTRSAGAGRPPAGQYQLRLDVARRDDHVGGPDPAQTALPIYPIRAPIDRPPNWSPERVRDLPPRVPWAGGHQPGDGQYPIRGVRAERMRRERLAYRFVPDPGRPHPADLGRIPPDHLARPLPHTPQSRLRWTPPPPRIRRPDPRRHEES